jgi:hypothetical protein
MSCALKILVWMFGAWAVLPAAFSYAACSTDQVIVKGKVENAPRNAVVRVELVYPKQQGGYSGETTIENESFTIKVPFYTQSRAPVLNANWFEKCGRKPKTVIVILAAGEREYDRVSLDLAKDFTTPYPTAYILRSELVLHGPVKSD